MISGDLDSSEHQSTVQILEQRWNDLRQQIDRYEKELDQSIIDYELDELSRTLNEYKTWIEAVPSTMPSEEIQVKLQLKENLFFIESISTFDYITE